MRPAVTPLLILAVLACSDRPSQTAPIPTVTRSILATVGDSASRIEGIAEFAGRLYVCDWKDGTIYRIDPTGPIPMAVGQLPVEPGTAVLGLRTDQLGNLYLAVPESGTIYRVAADRLGAADFNPTDDAVVFATGALGANAIAFDRSGVQLWITGGPTGTLYRVGPQGGAVSVAATGYAAMASDSTVANRAYTVNGVAINGDGALFTGNTGTGEITRMVIGAAGEVGATTTFVQDDRLIGADGLFMDDQDNLWVSANYRNTLARVGPDGTVTIVASSTPSGTLNDSTMVAAYPQKGAENALRFPAELTRVGNTMYLANLNFPIGANTGQPVMGASVAAVTLP